MTIRLRIAGTMAMVLIAAGVTAWTSWSMTASADEAASEAIRASERAVWAAETRAQLRGYISEAGDVAHGLGEGDSAEVSSEYGDLIGADEQVRRLIGSSPMNDASREELDRDWSRLRTGVADWLNTESASASQPFRIVLSERALRASTATNVTTPPELQAMTVSDKRRQVRAWAESLADGRMRLAANSAQDEARAAQATAARARRSASVTTLALLLANFIVALVSGVWLYRTIAKPIQLAQQVASRVAGGELDAFFPATSADEIGQLLDSVEHMRDVVVGKISTMREAAGAVLVTSESLQCSILRARDLGADDDRLPVELGEMDGMAIMLNGMARQMIED